MTSVITPRRLLRFLVNAETIDLESSARECRAFLRARAFDDSTEMLSAVLAYAASDASFKDTAAALSADGTPISRCAMQACTARCEKWPGLLVDRLLGGRDESEPDSQGLRLCAIDSTALSGPGSHGADCRVHATCDPLTGAIMSLKVAGVKVGERIEHHPVAPDWCALLDRGYPTRNNISRPVDAGASFIVRHVPQNLRLLDGGGERFNPAKIARAAKIGAPVDIGVTMPPGRTNPGCPSKDGPAERFIALRLVVVRLPSDDLLWYLTNLPPEVSASQISRTYRLRWQIELLFKRLKSLAGLDRLKSCDGPRVDTRETAAEPAR